jgi:hypothetical protein
VLSGPRPPSNGTPASEHITVADAPNADGTNWEFGVAVTFAVAGQVTAIRYRRRATSVNTLRLRGWDPASTAFPLFNVAEDPAGASQTGLFTVTLPTPLAIPAGATRRFSIGSTGLVPGYNAADRAVTNSANCTFNTYCYNGAAGNYPGTTTPLWSFYVEPVFEPTGGGGTGGDGKDCDWWIDTTTHIIYGPKAGGVWPTSGTSMVGPGVPTGGTTGQVLTKTSATDFATAWQTPSGGGGVAVAYRHVQASAATTWTINHGLTFRPNVTAVDTTGRDVTPGAIDYPSDTSVVLSFSPAASGEAYLS